jgi:hypothetical protein
MFLGRPVLSREASECVFYVTENVRFHLKPWDLSQEMGNKIYLPTNSFSIFWFIYLFIYLYTEGAKKCIHNLRKEKTVL